jgi:tetratricopeptide (TPR) repeat protein
MAVSREQVVQTAEKFVSRGKIEAAIREYRKVLAENPNDANTLNRVGDLYARIQRIDDAVDLFNQIAAQYTKEGFFVKAIAIYKKIIKLNPTHLEVYERLAELYHKQGLVNEARTQYQVLADYYLKHENPTSAIAMYQKMAEVEPENPTYHVKLAELYHQQRLTEKALAEYRTIAELMLGANHAQEAAQVYERALDVDATNIPFITDAVLKLREAGHAAAAAHFLAAAIERNPQAERVARLVGADDGTLAGQSVAPAVELEPEEPDPLEPQLVLPAFPEADDEAENWSAEGLGIPRELFDSQPIAMPAMPEPERPEISAKKAPVPEEEEFELDLDDVFVLDIESEDEPASLVKPPADMLGEAPRRPAWAQVADELILTGPAVPGTAPEVQTGSPQDFELPGIEVEEEMPALRSNVADTANFADIALEIDLEPEIELEPDLELEAALASPSLEMTPLAPLAAEAEPAVELDLGEELDLEPLPDLDPLAAAPPQATPPLPIAPASSAIQIDSDFLERTAAELHPPLVHPREEDLVTEAEVLAKYGLEEKALDRLREALKLNSRHLPAHALAVQLHLAKGRHARVVELANQMAKAAASGSDREPWLKVRRRLLSAGYRLDGDQVLGGPVPAAPAASAASAAGRRVDDLLRGLLQDAPKRPAAKPPARPAAPAAPAPMAAPAASAPMASPPVTSAPLPPAPPSSPVSPPPSPPGQTFNLLEIGEMVENEDLDGVDFPPARIPPPPSSPPAASVSSGSVLDDSGGMSWLDEAEAGRERQGDGGGQLFADEDDFFDLAGELEQELSREEGLRGSDLLVQPAEQSLEQIVEGFKKGVAENLSPTDFDTHFNLGIAYREMGLLDEAIGEFQLASKSPQLLVPCCSMLGLCFLDKGLPELAVKWYRRGLESPNLSEDDSLGLLYDMGNVYDSMGDTDTAYQTFVEIYGINTNYRDVVARIEELGRDR